MKRILFFLLTMSLLFPAISFAQDEPIKVKKEKTTRMGVVVTGAPAFYNVDGHSSTGGMRFGAGFAMTMPFKPRDIEFPWHFNMQFNIMDVSTGTVDLGGRSGEDDILMIELFPMSFGADYVFNPLSTRGKFKVYGLGRFSFLSVGVPYISTSKLTSTTYRHLDSEFGAGVGAEIGLKYGWQHIEIAVGGFIGVNGTYSSEKSGSMSNMGVAASLFYYW